MSNLIKFAPNKSGALMTVSAKNAEWGSVRLSSEETAIDPTTGFIRSSKKSFLIKDKVEGLQKLLDMYPNGMPGKLYTVEALETEAPAEFQGLLNKNLSYEDAVSNFLKRAGSDGPELTVGGVRIIRYTKYDPTGTKHDTVVAHDNQEQVAEWRATQSASSANLAQ